MIQSVETVGFGRPATMALANAVRAAQADGPLAPVTVVVPSNFAGLAARRTLGSGLDGGRGVVNVSFVTPLRLAELLAADVLVDLRPLTNPVLASAVRGALADDPRPFGEVADHLATERAVARLYAELSRLTPDALDAVRADPWGSTAVGLYDRVRARLAGHHDEDAVVRAVLARPGLDAAVGSLGHIVWHLPETLSPSQTELIAAVLDRAPSTVIVGLTGHETADRQVLGTCRQSGVAIQVGAADHARPSQARDETGCVTTHGPPSAPPVAGTIVSVTDADEEVRAVVRKIMVVAADGVPLDRIGIFYPVSDPYVRIIEHHVVAAGLPANGPSPDLLADSVAGRTVRAALSLPDEGWRRDRVMALVSGSPLRTAAGPVHPRLWERVSRDAGVVRSLGDWQRKLTAFAGATDRPDPPQPSDRPDRRESSELAERPDHAELSDDAEAAHRPERRALGPDSRRRAHDAAIALREFVGELATVVEAVRSAATWAGKASATRELLTSLLGSERDRQRWPERERDDFDRVVDALTRLAALDPLEPTPSHATFRRALDAELDVSRERSKPYGTGVVYGPLTAATGHDLDAVFVVGMTEGLCPRPRRDEAMLPERVRLLAGGQLTTPDDAMASQHRALLAALAAAPPDRRTMTFPRGDLRGSRSALPSRWLLDTASSLAGRPVHSTDFASLDLPDLEVVPSFTAGLRTGDDAHSIDERDLAAVSAHLASCGPDSDPTSIPSLAPVARSITMQRARRSSDFTEWDGNLAGQPVRSPAAHEALSATRLERWASCGFQYFLHDVLGLALRDEPERIVSVSALDRGSVVHGVLERFLAEAIEQGAPHPDVPWSPAWRERLHAIGDKRFDELEALGRTGRALRWQLERTMLHDVLDVFLDADDQLRKQLRTRPARVELPFGLDGADPVELRLDDGRLVRFRGMADRVDVDESGAHLIFDYKTGRGTKYAKLGNPDPVLEGTTLQLGLYAEAGRQQLGADRLAGWYWMLEAGPKERFAGYEWTSDRRQRFMDVLHTIVDGIEQGVFPQVPGDWNIWRATHENCAYCDFDAICPVGRGDHADAKAAAPALAVRAGLRMPETGTDDGHGEEES